MYDVTFCVILVTTMLSGYYKRDERNREYLELYNEEFPQMDKVRLALDRAFDFVEECRFAPESRAWKQTDLFTLLVEAHRAINDDHLSIHPVAAGERVQAFFDKVDGLYKGRKLPDEAEVPKDAQTVFAYLKAATKATNDKYSRAVRGRIIGELLRNGHQAGPGTAHPAQAKAGPSKPTPTRAARARKK